MGIKFFKGSEHSLESKSALKYADNFTLTMFDGDQEPIPGTHRLLSSVFVIENGKPFTYTSIGPTVAFVIEGEYDAEDMSTSGKPNHFTKGDVILSTAGTVIRGSSPSKARVFATSYVEANIDVTDTLS